MDLEGISVVVPLYNKEKFIERTINSILKQTYQKFEIIVIDDGSTDSSIEIVKNINDHRIVLKQQENAGVSVARNNGVNSAMYEYIAFLDADDEWYPNHLEELCKLVQKFPDANLWVSGYERSTQKNQSLDEYKIYKLEEYLTDRLRGIRIAWTSAVLVSKVQFLKKSGFMPNHNHGEDQALWLDLVSTGYIAKSYRITAKYNIYDDSLSSRLVVNEDACMLTVEKIIEQNNEFSVYLKSLLKEFKYHYALAHAINAFLQGKRDTLKFFIDISKNTKKFKKKRLVLLFLYYSSFLSKKLSKNIFILVSKKGIK